MGPSGPIVSECSWLATGIPASVVVAGRDCDELISLPFNETSLRSRRAGLAPINQTVSPVPPKAARIFANVGLRSALNSEDSQGAASVPDHVEHHIWVGQHRNVAAGHLGDLSVHALRRGSFEIG